MEEAGRVTRKGAAARAADVRVEGMVKARVVAEMVEVLKAAALALESVGWAVAAVTALQMVVAVQVVAVRVAAAMAQERRVTGAEVARAQALMVGVVMV